MIEEKIDVKVKTIDAEGGMIYSNEGNFQVDERWKQYLEVFKPGDELHLVVKNGKVDGIQKIKTQTIVVPQSVTDKPTPNVERKKYPGVTVGMAVNNASNFVTKTYTDDTPDTWAFLVAKRTKQLLEELDKEGLL